MPKLQDDPKVQALIEKSEARGRNEERKRISGLVAGEAAVAADIEDAGQKKAVKATIKAIKGGIRG